MVNISKDAFVEVVADALQGKTNNLQMRIRLIIQKLKKESPELATELNQLLIDNSGSDNATRSINTSNQPSPVDADTRQKLLIETYPVVMTAQPLWHKDILISLNRFVGEWEKRDRLIEAGLIPSRSLLMDGPPGVGKTLAAKWLAYKLNLPLLTLDLASVMSSYLGKTGNNIRSVLEYAKSFPCVLLMDEFDSIAKKRDDSSDVGELKRLVTVLLQSIDEWPNTSIILAATNHGELLDPAVWRRFDKVVSFENPTVSLIQQFLTMHQISEPLSQYLSQGLVGQSFAVIERSINQAKRNAILENLPIGKAIVEELYSEGSFEEFAVLLFNNGMSQRQISTELNLSRPKVKNIVQP